MYETEADRALASAKEATQDAIRNLSAVVVGDMPGSDEFASHYALRMREALAKLLDARALLIDRI